MSDKNKNKPTWNEIKELCQLSDEVIKMAKDLKLSTNQIIKSLELSKQPGKLSVENWIRNLHRKQTPSQKEPEAKPIKTKPTEKIQISPDKIIGFPSSKTETKSPKAEKSTKSALTEKKFSEIRQLLLNIEDDADELPLKLWDLIQWVVENEKESFIREIILSDEEISDAGLFALDFVLKDVGYRYPVSLPVKGKKGKYHSEEFELIPFAILMMVPVEDEKLGNVPTKLPKTIEKLTKDKILTKALSLGERLALLLDSHLYHVDHNEWVQESSVMKYLDSYSRFLSNSDSSISPLTEDYKKPSVVAREKVSQDLPHFCLVMRAICGAVVAHEDDALEIEELLFDLADSIDSESKIEAKQKAWEKVEEIVVKEFEQSSISLPHGMFINPSAVELWDIPHVSISLSRILPLQIELQNAIAQLGAETEDEEIFTPTLYVSQHGENQQIEEIRLAAYSDPNQGAFFSYVWAINPEFDDPDDVANTVITIANELEAEVVALEGLRPKDYCADCGEALFYGPGENQEAIIHNHEEYIN